MTTFTPIITKHGVLTRITENDLDILKEIFDDVETRRFLPELYELLDSPDGILKFVSTFELYAKKREGVLCGIKNYNKLCGFVAIMDLKECPTLFYAMHPNHRSSGYMKDALCRVINYLCHKKAIRTICTDVYKENIISTTLLQQLGFNVCKEDDKKYYMIKSLNVNLNSVKSNHC